MPQPFAITVSNASSNNFSHQLWCLMRLAPSSVGESKISRLSKGFLFLRLKPLVSSVLAISEIIMMFNFVNSASFLIYELSVRVEVITCS